MEQVLGGVARTTDVARSVPTLFAFVDGELVATREDGFLGVEEVTVFLDEATVDGVTVGGPSG